MTKLENALIEFIEKNFGIPSVKSVDKARQQQRAIRMIAANEGGIINRRVLQRKMSGVKAREFNCIIELMLSSGIIRANQNGRGVDLILN